MADQNELADLSTPVAPISISASIPWLGIVAVLLGTFLSTLNGRFSTFGLADIRGAVHAGFDEGAWITTSQTTAQMLVALLAVWAGGTFGPRRVLLISSIAFAIVSLITPFAPNLQVLLVFQFAGGIASGCFVPLTLSFLLFNTPAKFWAFCVAIYALNLELSLNISASLEGWYLEHWSWQWLYWQSVPIAVLMALCLQFGIRQSVAPLSKPRADVFGLVSGGVGFSLIYAALDQGNRLDWFQSGVIVGLLVAGAVLVIAFVIHESRTDHPIIDFKLSIAGSLTGLLILVSLVRLTVMSTAYLIPLYLGAVRGFRALEVGQTLKWIAIPQLIVCAVAGALLRRLDARLVGSIGFVLIAVACWLVADGLTPLWGSDQFVVSQVLQAVGQSLALSGIIFYAVLFIRPKDAIALGAVLQVARLLGGEIGLALIGTFARVRSQVASNLIGQHVKIGDGQVLDRLKLYASAAAPAADSASALGRSLSVLSSVVRSMATTQGVIDSFIGVGAISLGALLLLVVQRGAPDGPSSPKRPYKQAPGAAL
jgi:MFS transporter, DHA2 family, multidrug resistance protein